jgi:hypothetical protein
VRLTVIYPAIVELLAKHMIANKKKNNYNYFFHDWYWQTTPSLFLQD